MIEIREVKTKKDVRLFATYPLKLYKNCPYYVPSLRDDEMNTFNPKKNFSLKTSGFQKPACLMSRSVARLTSRSAIDFFLS